MTKDSSIYRSEVTEDPSEVRSDVPLFRAVSPKGQVTETDADGKIIRKASRDVPIER